MKKFLFLVLLLLLCQMRVFALDTISLQTNSSDSFTDTVLDIQDSDDNPVFNIDEKTIYLNKNKESKYNQNLNYDTINNKQEDFSSKFFLMNIVSNAAKDIYNLEIERTDVPSALLKDKLTFERTEGPVENIHIWTAVQSNFLTDISEHDTGSKFDIGLINILIDGKFKGGQENFRIMLDPAHRSTHTPFMQTFFQDLYIESRRIPHTRVLIGNSRPGVGIEGAQSPYTLSFINRSQIARNLANQRKFGVRVRGDYSLMDYDAGVYSSSTNFSSFFPGHEVDAWVNVKPLGKTDGKYGKLVTGAGIQSGEKHGTSYYMTGAYAGYEYKKFWTKFEYARANGSNGGSGLTNKHAQGLFITAAYKLTKKTEILARYDDFDPDRNTAGNNRKEITFGTNYYLKGQALKLIFNYVFCKNDCLDDSHRLMVGTQVLL